MKTILVDDEAMALEVLEQMLSTYEEVNIIGKYTKHRDALESIRDEKPDVIFLDIEMGDMNGLELAEVFMEKLNKVEIVFVTAYSEYAVDAFELNAIDYLLKPIQKNRLVKAVERLKEKVKINKLSSLEKKEEGLKVYSFGGFQVTDNMGDLLTWRTQKAKELFAYLWNEDQRSVSRDLIIEDVFPDRDLEKATTLLHTTVYQLRKNLEKLGYVNGIVYLNDSYRLDIESTGDRERLNEIISLGRYNDGDIKEILKIYRGDFLEEGYLWGMEKQEIYRQVVFNKLVEFAEGKIEKREFNLILEVSLDKAYEMDPLNEGLIEIMLHYYGKQNKLCNLENVFRNYKKELWDEMNLRPIKNIVNTYEDYMKIV